MWFKNMRVYRWTRRLDFSAETLTDNLSKNRFKPCSRVDFSRSGWVAPMGNPGEQLVHTVGQYHMICLRRQEKILPAAAINEQLQDQVASFEKKEARKIYRKEKVRLKEDILHDLLPNALTRSAYTFAFIDTKAKHLVIDTPSAAKADEFTDNLRAAYGELPIVPLSCHGDAATVMTRWVKNRLPKAFSFDDECELKNQRDAQNIVRCRKQEISSGEILEHIRAGKRVTQLAVNWREAIRFVLCEDFSLKRVKYDDKQAGAEEHDDAAAAFDQDFSVMTIQTSQLLKELIEEFGGPAKAS